MTSYFERHGGLRQLTMEPWERLSSGSFIFETRLTFWLRYLHDVVPEGVVVCHVPVADQIFDLNPPNYPNVRRTEVQLRCMEGILMTGIVSFDYHSSDASDIAAFLAYQHASDGLLVHDPDQAWGTFTGLALLSFYVSDDGLDPNDYRHTATFNPMTNVRDVVRYIRPLPFLVLPQ